VSNLALRPLLVTARHSANVKAKKKLCYEVLKARRYLTHASALQLSPKWQSAMQLGVLNRRFGWSRHFGTARHYIHVRLTGNLCYETSKAQRYHMTVSALQRSPWWLSVMQMGVLIGVLAGQDILAQRDTAPTSNE
jgi:hypothetical protein